MSVPYRSRLNRIAAVASGAMLLFGGAALAQTVQVFDDSPSVEQLRRILTPETSLATGQTRSIVIMRSDAGAPSTAVQRASTQVLAAPRTDVATQALPAQPVVHVSSSVPVPAVPQPPKPRPDAGAVAFHINFAFNSAALPASAHEMVGRMAQFMKESPDVNILVEGHTDAAGNPNYNMSLSKRRALSVADYLVDQGVDPARILPVGKGMTEPLTSDRFDPANRRVQFVRAG